MSQTPMCVTAFGTRVWVDDSDFVYLIRSEKLINMMDDRTEKSDILEGVFDRIAYTISKSVTFDIDSDKIAIRIHTR